MTRIMKRYFNPLFILLLATLVISSTNVWAQIPEKVGCYSMDGKTYHHCGEHYPDNYNGVDYDCICDCSGRSPDCKPISKSGGNISNPGGGQSIEKQLVQTLIESLFDAAFKKPGNSQQQMSDPNEQAEAQHKKEALQRWLDFQSTEAMKKEAEKTKQREDLILQMQTIGNEGAVEPFSIGNPKLDIQPVSQNSFPTSGYTEWQRLLCSAYFSNLAAKSTNDLDSRFYADQAERVMAGEPTFIECRMPKVSDEKAKRMEEVKILYNEMNVKFKDLQYIECNLIEVRDSLDKIVNKKAEATKKINKLQNGAEQTTPEEKSKIDDLVLQAQKELEEAEKEFNLATQAEKDLLVRKENSEKKLSNLRNQIQGKIQSEEEEK